MKNTIIHDNNKHSTIHHFGLPGSSIEGDASKVVRYQKYAVSEDLAHSATSVPFLSRGHDDHGNGYWNGKIYTIYIDICVFTQIITF